MPRDHVGVTKYSVGGVVRDLICLRSLVIINIDIYRYIP